MIDRLCEPGMVAVTWVCFVLVGVAFIAAGLIFVNGQAQNDIFLLAGIWAIWVMACWLGTLTEPARPDAQEARE